MTTSQYKPNAQQEQGQPRDKFDQARAWFAVTHRHTPQDAYVGLTSYAVGAVDIRNEFYQCRDLGQAVMRAVNLTGREVFARISALRERPSSGRGKESDSIGASVLWADFDNVRDEQALVDKLEALLNPPTMTVRSGRGVHAYWSLDRFETDLTGIKARNRGLAQIIGSGADHVHDLARVMRVAGTTNHKDGQERACEILSLDEARVYTLGDFAAVEHADDSEEVRDWDEEPVPDDFLNGVQAQDANLYKRILSEHTALEAGASRKAGGGVDRSANDFYIAVRLLELGYSPGQVLTVLMHPRWFSGERFREKGGYGYVTRTVAAAQRVVPPNPLRYFQGRTFHPSILGRELKGEHDFLFVDQLRHYQGGVFVPNNANNRRFIEDRITEKLEDLWRPNRAAETTEWVEIKSMPGMPTEEIMERNSRYLNVRNGMLDWETGLLLPHHPSYLSLAQIPVQYAPDVDPTVVDRFIADVVPEDAIPVLWEFVGSILIRDKYWPKAFLLLIGDKDSGKSKVVSLLQYLLGGSTHTSSLPLQSLAEREFVRSALFGKFANLFADLQNTEARDVGWIKTLTGDDYITVDRKHRDPFTFKNVARLIFSANHYPAVRNPDEAYFGRAVVIRCPNKFVAPAEGQNNIGARTRSGGVVKAEDRDILRKLTTPDNLSAVLNRALEGRRRLEAQGGFSHSQTVEEGRTGYRATIDSAVAFIEDATERDADARVVKSFMYSRYRAWCIERGRQPMSDQSFFKRIAEQMDALGIGEVYAELGDLASLGQLDGRRWQYTGRRLTYTPSSER